MENKRHQTIWIARRRVMLLGFICALSVCAPGQRAVKADEPQAASKDDSILKYWPIDAPKRHWDVGDAQGGTEAANATLSITNESLEQGKVVLWFSNPERHIAGATNGEEYRYCYAMGRSWVFLDEYLSGTGPGQWTPRPVSSSRILLTVDGEKPVDLIADGTYAGCGSVGQPYLMSNDAIQQYRLQIWGYLTKNPKYKWYWDATVSKPAVITNNCFHPSQTVRAMKVQEAWWSNFAAINGNENNGGWTMGSAGNLGADGMPDGMQVKDGRTVWHAEGQIPYYETGSPDGRTVRKCINRMPVSGQ